MMTYLVNTTIDNSANDVGKYTSLAFNAATNTPAISYWDWTNDDLKYAAYVPAGDISVSSDPASPWIRLDGVNATKQTNTTLTGMVPGTYDVTVQKHGYHTPANETVAVVSSATTAVSFDLIYQSDGHSAGQLDSCGNKCLPERHLHRCHHEWYPL